MWKYLHHTCPSFKPGQDASITKLTRGMSHPCREPKPVKVKPGVYTIEVVYCSPGEHWLKLSTGWVRLNGNEVVDVVPEKHSAPGKKLDHCFLCKQRLEA